jgi:cation:H+ antiporter
MLLDILLFVVGLVVLYFGAEWLVGGSSGIAYRVGITPLIVGCTVVAFGTSAPELVVSLAAVYQGNDDISVGNIIGSNIANLALITGVAAIIRPIQVSSSVVRREYPFMFAASILLVVLGFDGKLSRLDAGILLSGMAIYMGYMINLARKAMNGEEVELSVEEIDEDEIKKSSNGKDIARIVAGIAGLVIGARLMVDSAVSIARVMEIPDLVIGITVVAIGTSLPELATSAMASLRNESDISVGNVIGSNVFNILLVLGTVAVIAPIAVGEAAIEFDFWVMLGVTLLIWPLMWSGLTIKRWEGAVLLAGYVAYTVYLFV